MSALKKTNLNSVSDLRQTTDDNLSSVLTQLGYDESFKITDIKLALGVSTVAIAGLLFLVDRKYSFDESYNVVVISIILYSIFSAGLLYLNRIYKNVKYIGYTEKGEKIIIAGWTVKFDPLYYIKITLNDKTTIESSLKFNEFFDVVGYFNRDAFTTLLKHEISKKSQ
ncbi:putative signal peptidase complex subunit [Scheffersomyces coipomensis]|uniref:putative signal peptidase complex subunit n=1 Tax=Scheffersomyces coipomensis TaxID=1788519 RepID=UPI00315CB560